MTRARALKIATAVLLTAWLVPAIFVAVYDPRTPALPFEDELIKTNPFWPHGYAQSGSTESWEEGGPRFKTSWAVQRGTLDRMEGSFPLAARYATRGGTLKRIRLLVTNRSDWIDREGDQHWTEIAAADAINSAAACSGVAPADSVAFAIEASVHSEPAPIGFSRTMPEAETLLGRVYDKIAYLPVFAWVPDLR